MSMDGKYGNKFYEGSGSMTTDALRSAFLTHTDNVEASSVFETRQKAILSALNHDADFLVYPVILHWEDRATEWSSIPDKVEVKVSLIEPHSQQVVEAIIVSGRSGLATFGGDHPQDLLPEPISDFVNTLY